MNEINSKSGNKSLTRWLGRRGAGDSARVEAFLDAAPAEYCGFGDDGSVVYSQGFCTLLGLNAINDIHDIQHALSPSDAAVLEGLFIALQQEGHGFAMAVHAAVGDRVFRLSGKRGRDLSGRLRFDILWLEDETETHDHMTRFMTRSETAESERDRLQSLLDAVPQPLWTRSENGDLTWCNRAYARIVDATPATVIAEKREIAAKPLRKTGMNPGSTGRQLALDALGSGQDQSTAAHVVSSGRRRLLQVSERPLTDYHITLGSVEDRTREEELETEQRRYATANKELLGQMGTAIAVFDGDQKLDFFNAAFAQLWDIEDSALNARPRLGDLMEKLRERRRLPEQVDFRRFKQGWLNMFTTLIGPHDEMLYLPDGTALRMLVVPHPMGGLMMTFEDVSSRLALESSYNTLVAVQKETLDNLSEGVAVFGGDGRLKLWNPAFMRLWGLHPEDLAGEPHISRLVERLKPCFEQDGWEEARSKLMAQCLDRRSGTARLDCAWGRLVACTAVPLPDGGVLATHVDITDTVRVENALREKNAALEAAERLKIDFLANVSYQLRTPLSTIVGFAEILGNEYFGPLNPRQKEYTSGMQDAGERLVSLVNDILDLSTIEAGYMELHRRRVDLAAMLEDLRGLTEDWARRENIGISVTCAPDAGAVQADESRLKQVLLNLIRNAIANTPGGRIDLSARREGQTIILGVKDNGRGIPAEDQKRIFEPFERGQGQPAGRGAGLGLTIVKTIVELHGGSVGLASAPGEGTEITITLPGEG